MSASGPRAAPPRSRHAPRGWRAWLEPLWMGLYPGRCAACDASLPWRAADEALCDACRALEEAVAGPWCPICGTPHPIAGGVTHVCGACHAARPPYAARRAPRWYQGPWRDAILRFKLGGRPDLHRALAAPLLPLVRAAGWSPDVLLAVPMTRRALRARGHNPAALLCLTLARALGRPARLGWISKVRDTAPQRGLTAPERRDNVRGAFRGEPAVKGRRLLLVDDVATTGATAEACARALRRAGAREVVVVTLALTPYDRAAWGAPRGLPQAGERRA